MTEQDDQRQSGARLPVRESVRAGGGAGWQWQSGEPVCLLWLRGGQHPPADAQERRDVSDHRRSSRQPTLGGGQRHRGRAAADGLR